MLGDISTGVAEVLCSSYVCTTREMIVSASSVAKRWPMQTRGPPANGKNSNLAPCDAASSANRSGRSDSGRSSDPDVVA